MIYDPIRTLPPDAIPVSLHEFKAQARVDTTDEDAIMMAHLRSAIELTEQFTGLALITSTWTQTFETWPSSDPPDLILLRRPVQAVLSIEYRETIGSPVGTFGPLDPASYRVIGLGQDRVPARLRPATSWPVLYSDPEAIRITYQAGFGDDGNSVPELIRHAILMAAAAFYDFREDVVMGTTISELPFASKALLRHWRPLAVA